MTIDDFLDEYPVIKEKLNTLPDGSERKRQYRLAVLKLYSTWTVPERSNMTNLTDQSKLLSLVNEWLQTLSDEPEPWDGLCISDRAMARAFLIDGRVGFDSFLTWVAKREPV